MADAKVERRHREAAAEALEISAPESWLESGKPAGVVAPADLYRAARVAKSIANAEQAAVERERERWLATIGVMVDEMLRDAEEQGVHCEGEDGLYRYEIETLRTLELRTRADHVGGKGE